MSDFCEHLTFRFGTDRTEQNRTETYGNLVGTFEKMDFSCFGTVILDEQQLSRIGSVRFFDSNYFTGRFVRGPARVRNPTGWCGSAEEPNRIELNSARYRKHYAGYVLFVLLYTSYICTCTCQYDTSIILPDTWYEYTSITNTIFCPTALKTCLLSLVGQRADT